MNIYELCIRLSFACFNEEGLLMIESNEERRMQLRAAKAKKSAYKLARLVVTSIYYLLECIHTGFMTCV